MSGPVWSRRCVLKTLIGLGSLCALEQPGTGQEPAPVQIDNQYRIKAKLLYYLPEFMTWDAPEKQKGDVWIGVITHGDSKTDFKAEIAVEKLKLTPSGRKVNWVLYNTVDDLIKATPTTGSRWHLVFVMRKTEEIVLQDLNKLDAHFSKNKKPGVVLVTEENTKFRRQAAVNFWEDVTVNRIRIQLRNTYLRETIGVTPKKEMLEVEGVILYDKP